MLNRSISYHSLKVCIFWRIEVDIAAKVPPEVEVDGGVDFVRVNLDDFFVFTMISS